MNSHRLSIACAAFAFWGVAAYGSERVPTPQAPVEGAAVVAVAAPVAPASADAAAAAPAEAASAPGEPDASLPDEPVIEAEKKLESDELEQMRAAEEQVHPLNPDDADDVHRDGGRSSLDSPLKRRLGDAAGRERGPSTEQGGRIAGLPELDHDLRQLQAEYDIPIEVNAQVVSYVRFFQNVPLVRKHFVKWLGRSHRFLPVFRQILREEGLPEDTVYLSMIESGFANMATSRAKAVGTWQFISETGRRMGLHQDYWVDERRDPEKAARAAATYLKELYRQTGDWRLAWAGYNAGVGKIYRAWEAGQRDFWSMTRGRVLKAETKGYVPKLMAAAIIAKHPEEFGFTRAEIEPERWQAYERVTIPRATPLSAIAKAAETSEQSLLDLNPELRRTCTPPRPVSVKVPYGQAGVFAENWPEVEDTVARLAFAQHSVGRGDTLKSIAHKYGVEQATLARMNGLRTGRHLKAGLELVVPLNAASRDQALAFASAEPQPPPDVADGRRTAKSLRARRAEARAALVLARREATSARAGKGVAAKADGEERVAVAAVGRPERVTGSARASSAAARARSTVQVRSGDTLWSISQRFGVAVDELCRWNGIRSPKRFKLVTGKSLVVYPRRGEASNEAPAARVRAG